MKTGTKTTHAGKRALAVVLCLLMLTGGFYSLGMGENPSREPSAETAPAPLSLWTDDAAAKNEQNYFLFF